uniref:G-protein coupled receptors family 1 profile domain-containing protein n=1 Tax=Crocodylus porosus TaxID=8502 RepID=A0A7M4F269_CROPO
MEAGLQSLPSAAGSVESCSNIVTVLICLLGLVGNGIVLWFLGCRIKKNTFTVYILNLAVTDLGFLLSLAAFLIIYLLGHFICKLLRDVLRILLLLGQFTYTTSICLLTAISIERCLSVLCPIWYKIHRPKHLSACLCALLWTFSFLMNGLSFISWLYGSHKINSMTNQVLLILIFPVITPIIVISNLILFVRIRCILQHHQPGRLYIVILLTVLFFLLFAVPVTAFMFFEMHGKWDIDICLLLASANSSINPVIYFLVGSYRKQRFRCSVKLALQRAFYEKGDCGEVGEVRAAEALQTAT